VANVFNISETKNHSLSLNGRKNLMPKSKRRLWLGLEIISVPQGTPRLLIIETLKESIRRGDYSLPRGWQIDIRWRNSPKARMKQGPWTEEMTKSAASSSGFDSAVLSYLSEMETL
jgi:hypothetical protein